MRVLRSRAGWAQGQEARHAAHPSVSIETNATREMPRASRKLSTVVTLRGSARAPRGARIALTWRRR